ncbi:MAG: hypothetical protein JO283_05990 [Bradyrhizobium sp.]|nr:hypothetical protein [Bradyrhizobium sp.]
MNKSLSASNPAALKPLRISQGSPAFSIVDPAGTWTWRSGPMEGAVRRGALLAPLAAEAAVQLRAVEAPVGLPRRAEAAEAAVQLRAAAAAVELS